MLLGVWVHTLVRWLLSVGRILLLLLILLVLLLRLLVTVIALLLRLLLAVITLFLWLLLLLVLLGVEAIQALLWVEGLVAVVTGEDVHTLVIIIGLVLEKFILDAVALEERVLHVQQIFLVLLLRAERVARELRVVRFELVVLVILLIVVVTLIGVVLRAAWRRISGGGTRGAALSNVAGSAAAPAAVPLRRSLAVEVREATDCIRQRVLIIPDMVIKVDSESEGALLHSLWLLVSITDLIS